LPEYYCIDCERHQTFAVAHVLCLLWNFYIFTEHIYTTRDEWTIKFYWS